MHEVIRYVVDDGEFLEVFPLWADEHRDRVRAARRAERRRDREPAEGPGRARSTSTRARRRRGSFGSATRSTSRS